MTALTSVGTLLVTAWAARSVNLMTKISIRKQEKDIIEKIIEHQNKARKIALSAKPQDIMSSLEFYEQLGEGKALAELYSMNDIAVFLEELTNMHAAYKAKLNKSKFIEIGGYLHEADQTHAIDKETAVFFDKLNNYTAYKNYLNGL